MYVPLELSTLYRLCSDDTVQLVRYTSGVTVFMLTVLILNIDFIGLE